MRILFLIHNISYCGAERVLALIANELCNRGHDIYILTNPKEINYPLDSRIKVLDAYQFSKAYTVTNPLGKVLRVIKYFVGFSRTLKKSINEVKPDHIVSFLGFCIWQLLPYRHKFRITISDHSAMERTIGRVRDYERRVLPEKFYQHTVLTRADKDFLGPKRSNVIVMNNPLTFNRITDKEYGFLFDSRSDILFCGSIDRYKVKGLDNLIKALSIVKHEIPNIRLDVAGNGSDNNIRTLERLASDYGVDDNIHFLGFREDISTLMKNHSALVVPSRSEGFGMVIIEAMACGCPVISYALSGPCEIIENGEDGILVENQNINKLAESIICLVKDKCLQRRIGENALHSVGRFSTSSIVDKWEQILK